MNHFQLQSELIGLNLYHGRHDGLWGPKTRKATLDALTFGPDTPITEADITEAARRLRVDPAAVRAVYEVESSGDPFIAGRPTILFEPHRFSRSTKHRYDRSHPYISYRRWGARRYPRTQAQRYDQLLDAVGLDVDAGFMSASWGGFQILGENYRVCGYSSPWAFAYDQSIDVGNQLDAFVSFCISNGLDRHLRAKDWARFARGYNGTGYKQNHYDTRLRDSYARYLRREKVAA